MTTFAYILSPHYSGSTLLTFLLAQHRQIATIGELKASAMGDIEVYQCSCGELIRQCPFWKRIQVELAARGFEFDVADFGTHFRERSNALSDRILRARVRGAALETVRGVALRCLPSAGNKLEQTLQRNLALIDAIMNVQGGRVFLDGSKDPIRLKYFLDAECFDVRVIHMVRDGRAVSNSAMRHDGVSMQTAAREWRETHAECERILRRLPSDSYLTLRYEDLCNAPDAELDRIYKLLGLDPTDLLRGPVGTNQHILGNSMRLASTSTIRLDQKWRTALGADELECFERIAGETNHHYGYE